MNVAVALVTLAPGQPGGTESYARALLDRLAAYDDPRVTVIATDRVAATFARPGLRVHAVRSPANGRGALARLAGMAWMAAAPPSRSRPARTDVIHYPVTVPLPRAGDAATVVSLHDVLHHEHPEFVPRAERLYRSVAYDRAARTADHVVTVSEHARREIIDRLGIEDFRVTAVPHGLDHRRFAPERDAHDAALPLLPEHFVLYPANLWPHKNHERLLRAFSAAGVKDLHLVLTGQTYGRPVPGPGSERVHHLGHLPFDQLPALYRRASALVFPSLFEGFGMPLVEAMACGCPVAASDRGAIAEVCGDAALRFDPTDEDAIADAIRRVMGDVDLRARLVAAGLARATRFRWDDAARRHVEVYRSARAARMAR